MAYFYFDESIHERAGLIVGAFVVCDADPALKVQRVLRRGGLRPGMDEFRSGFFIARNPKLREVREHLRGVISSDCSIAVTVSPASDRATLGSTVLKALARFVQHGEWSAKEAHEAHLDSGLFPSREAAVQEAARLLPENVIIHPEQDSREVPGIQLADLVAHSAALMLLDLMGFEKRIKAEDSWGYGPDVELTVGFEMFMNLRYRFRGVAPRDPDDKDWEPILQVEPYGLYVSPACSPDLATAARARFGKMWLGCTH